MMFPLLKLPNELILRIVDEVHPGDIEALSICSKTVRDLTAEALSRHLQLKKKYTTIIFSGGFHRESSSDEDPLIPNDTNPLLLLGEIIQNSHLAYYPRRVLLGRQSFASRDLDEEIGVIYREEAQRYEAAAAELAPSWTALINQSPFLDDHEKAEWRSAFRRKSSINSIIAMLITLTNNVQDLTLHTFRGWRYEESSPIWKMIQRMVAISRSSDPKMIHRDTFLSKLEKFTVNFSDDDEPKVIQTFASIAILPSMRTLKGRFIRGEVDAMTKLPAFVWPASFLKGTSTITAIDFDLSAIDLPTFRCFLAGIAALRIFRYHHHKGMSRLGYKPSKIIAMLKEYAGTSLVELSLSAYQGHLTRKERNTQHVESLQTFAALKTIRLDDELIKKLAPDSSNQQWLVARLVDILPKAVETVHLRRHTEVNNRIQMFQGLAALKAKHFTHLRYIISEEMELFSDYGEYIYYQPSQLPRSLSDSLESAGIVHLNTFVSSL